MHESALLASSYQNPLHTRLAEIYHGAAYWCEKFKYMPAQHSLELGRLGRDVRHAHCAKLDDECISLFAASYINVAHCIYGNMRLASSATPMLNMLDAGVSLGLGAEGSSSEYA